VAFFKYTRSLEERIKELRDERLRLLEDHKAEKKALQERVDTLIEALVPILRRLNESKAGPAEVKPIIQPHELEKGSDNRSARCSCGWTVTNEDPGVLQELIAEHYQKNVKALRGGRRTWAQARDLLEQQALTREKTS
jgi:hypothetical protein